MRPTMCATAAGIGVAALIAVSGSIAQVPGTAPPSPAPAQDGAPAPIVPQQKPAPGDAFVNGQGRYTFTRIDNRLLRLDSVSGQVTVCSEHAAGWACEAVPQERAALEKEIGRLQDEVVTLKAEVAALRAQAASQAQPPRPPADLTPAPDKKDDAKSTLLSPDRVESARTAIEKAWRRLVDMIVGLKNDVMRKG